MRLALLAAGLLALPLHAEEHAFERGSLAGGLRARWTVVLPAPRIAWLAPGEEHQAPATQEVALRFQGRSREGGPREHLEVLVGESTPRAIYLSARTRGGYQVLARLTRRDSQPLELSLLTRGQELAVRCPAYALEVSATIAGAIPLRGTASLLARGESSGELLELESLTVDGELPPAERYSPPGEETP